MHPSIRTVTRTLGIVAASAALAACARPHAPSFARAASPHYLPECPAGVIAIPTTAFADLDAPRVLAELRESRLLPQPEPVHVVRYDRETATLGIPAIYNGTSGPRPLDRRDLQLRMQRYRDQGGRRVATTIGVLVDASGVVRETRLPVPEPFLRRDEWRRGGMSASAREVDVVRLARETRFYPAVHNGCRLPSWTVMTLSAA